MNKTKTGPITAAEIQGTLRNWNVQERESDLDYSSSDSDIEEIFASDICDVQFGCSDSERDRNSAPKMNDMFCPPLNNTDLQTLESNSQTCKLQKSDSKKVILPSETVLNEPVDAFNLFVTNEIISQIVTCTNTEGERVYGSKKIKKWKYCDEIEIRAFLGLFLTCGFMKLHQTNYETLWSPIYGPPIIRATMGLCRFKSILKLICFDIKNPTSDGKEDKLAPIRDIWVQLNQNFRKYYCPGNNLTVTEQLIPFRGQCPIKQLKKNKPDPRGLKMWWLCDSDTSYPLNGFLYVGKQNSETNISVSSAIEKLVEPYAGTHKNIICDNHIIDMELTNAVMSKGLTITCCNRTKGNNDTLDQILLENMSKRKTSRWSLVFFFNAVDCASVAASILWAELHSDWGDEKVCRRKFIKEVAESLMRPNIQRRKWENGMTKATLDVISQCSAQNEAAKEPPRKKRCYECPSKLNRKQKQTCKLCTAHVCKEHSFVVCHQCFSKCNA